MIRKWQYKIWKKLTKALVPAGAERETIFWQHHLATQKRDQPATAAPSAPRPPRSIVAIKGFYYTGSSALVGFLQEFDNVRVVGFSEPAWSKTFRPQAQTECGFFRASGFIEMVQAFGHASPEEADVRLKVWMSATQRAYRTKRMLSHEHLPELYNDSFRKLCRKLMFTILELDDATRNIVGEGDLPVYAEELEPSLYDGCSFAHDTGKKQYFVYAFRRGLSAGEFHAAIAEYLQGLFSIIGDGDIVAYDQLFPYDELSFVNRYLPQPIREICVYRDPRDQFLAYLRKSSYSGPRSAQALREKLSLQPEVLHNTNPHRLCVRFEDLVLHYDETTQRIMDFIGLDPRHHVSPRSVFDPAISVANIGAWRHYCHPDFMREIYEALPEWCWQPEGAALTPEAQRLLMLSGNWDDVFCADSLTDITYSGLAGNRERMAQL